MNKKRPLLLLSALLFALSIPNAVAEKTKEGKSMLKPALFESHIRFLADNMLEGRGIDTRGGKLAALYIETIFRSAGLKPPFDGGYRQSFAMKAYSPDHGSSMRISSFSGKQMRLVYGKDFVGTNFNYKGNFTGNVTFIGYGINAPDFGWDDYKDADVKGKLLIGFVNEPGRDNPKTFRGRALTWFGRWTYKYEEAAKRGAAGLILIHNNDDAGYSWEVVRNSWSGDTYRLADDPYVLPLQFWIRERHADSLLNLAGYNLKQMKKMAESKDFCPVPLDVTVEISARKSVRSAKGTNIVGVLAGKDPTLKDKAIVFSAHRDHLGIGREINGDKIYNGAVDNGSALSTLLALAQEYSRTGKNRATLVFAAVDAEEEGLLGSKYYAQHPVIPASNSLANINFELSNVWGETKDVLAIGAEHSELSTMLKIILSKRNMTITPDPIPEQGYFYRSDQFSFAKVGIPSMWLDTGYNYIGRPEGWGEKVRANYRKFDYHRPSDEVRANWNYKGLVQLANICVELVRIIEQNGKVEWKPTSEFRK